MKFSPVEATAFLTIVQVVCSTETSSAREKVLSNAMHNLSTHQDHLSARILHPHPEHPHGSPAPVNTKAPKGGKKNPNQGGGGDFSTKEPKAGKKNPKNPKNPNEGGVGGGGGGGTAPSFPSAPSAPSPPGSMGVYDDPNYRFPLLFDGSMKPCSWITSNQFALDYRRDTYCADANIAGSCPISCGFNRFDDPDFTFPLLSNGSLQPCSWIDANEESTGYRRDVYCGRVGAFCPVSCGFHPFNTFPRPAPPTPNANTKAPKGGKKNPNQGGGGDFSTKEPKAGKKNPKNPKNPNDGGGNNGGGGGGAPTAPSFPSAPSAPSPPGSMGVYDDPNYRFPLLFDGSMKPCSWITSNQFALDYRRDTYCADANIAGSCPISCGFNRLDDPGFTFPLLSNGSLQPCSWIDANEESTGYRRDVYCGNVGTFCPVSCGFHPFNTFPRPAPPTPNANTKAPKGGKKNPNQGGGGDFSTKEPKAGKKNPKNPKNPNEGGGGGGGTAPSFPSAPSAPSPPGSMGVYDDPNYRFPLLFDGSMKPCSWITSNQFSLDYRRDTYCADANIAGSCPISCGFNRFDDPDFTFPLLSNGSLQPCSWIDANEESTGYRRDVYCGRVGAFCPVSCGFHPFNTFPRPAPPTPNANTKAPKGGKKNPNQGGGGDFSTKEPKAGKKNPKNPKNPNEGGVGGGGGAPTAPSFPSAPSAPSPPGSMGVYDDPNYRFPLLFDGSMKPCSWITSNQFSLDYRRDTYCADANIAGSCPISCGFNRFDDPDFTFPLLSNGSLQPCSWIDANEESTGYRRDVYCGNVGTFCPVSCGFHPFNTFPRPAPPTPNANTKAPKGGKKNPNQGGGGDFSTKEPKAGKKNPKNPKNPNGGGGGGGDNNGGGSGGGGGAPTAPSFPSVPSSPSAPSPPGSTGVYDDPNYRFPLRFDGSMQSCSWITSNTRSIGYRRDLYCADINIAGSCPISCGFNRLDDPGFTFPLLSNGSLQPCSWITENDEAIGYRRDVYCGSVGAYCPVSCGFHPFNTFPRPAPPTLSPKNPPVNTKAPKGGKKNPNNGGGGGDNNGGNNGGGLSPYYPSPSSPVNTKAPKAGKKNPNNGGGGGDNNGGNNGGGISPYYPSPSPPTVPSTPSVPSNPTPPSYNGNSDDPNFTFPLYHNGDMQPCSWLTQNPDAIEYRRETYCPDASIARRCPVSCGFNQPSSPNAPSAPTSPTPPSSNTGVYDDPDFLFPLYHNGSMQPCNWISSLASAIDYRRGNYCSDMNIAGSCPISCGFGKFDDPDFTFFVTENGKMQPCSWLTGDYRRNLYCIDVGASCPQSCKFHPFSTFPSPAPPTAPAGPPAGNPSNPSNNNNPRPTAFPKSGKKGSKKGNDTFTPAPNLPAPVPAPTPRATTSGGTDNTNPSFFAVFTTILATLAFFV